MKQQRIQTEYTTYQRLKQELQDEFNPKKIFQPFAGWFNRAFPLKDKAILDIGCLIESGIYRKFREVNDGSVAGYSGYDIDEQTAQWLKNNQLFFDLSKPGSQRFDYIFMIDVYEHLEPDERITILSQLKHLLKPGGKLCIVIPYTGNLNYFENFIGDWTHKIIKLEFEPAALVAFGGFQKEKIQTYLGGLTSPGRTTMHNILCIVRNLLALYPPFHLGIIIAEV